MGHSIANLSEMTMDEIMNKIDKLMYEDKTRFYKTHASLNRRYSDRNRDAQNKVTLNKGTHDGITLNKDDQDTAKKTEEEKKDE